MSFWNKQSESKILQAAPLERIITRIKVNPDDNLETKIGVEVITLFYPIVEFYSSYLMLTNLMKDREEMPAEAVSLYTTIICNALKNEDTTRTVLSLLQRKLYKLYHISLNNKTENTEKENINFNDFICEMVKDSLRYLNLKDKSTAKYITDFVKPKIQQNKSFEYNIGHNIMIELEKNKLFNQIKKRVIDIQDSGYTMPSSHDESRIRALYSMCLYAAVNEIKLDRYLNRVNSQINDFYEIGNQMEWRYNPPEKLEEIFSVCFNDLVSEK